MPQRQTGDLEGRVAIHSIHSTDPLGGMEVDASEISSVEWIHLEVKLNGWTVDGRMDATHIMAIESRANQ